MENQLNEPLIRVSTRKKTRNLQSRTYHQILSFEPQDKLNNHRILLLIGIMKIFHSKYPQHLKQIQQNQKQYKQQRIKHFKINRSLVYASIEPQSKIKENLEEAKQLITIFKTKMIQYIKKQIDRCALQQKVNHKIENHKYIRKSLRQTSINWSKEIINQQQPIKKVVTFYKSNFKLKPNETTYFQSKKKQEIYFFSRLNKTIENFSLNNQHKICIKILSTFSTTIGITLNAIQNIDLFSNLSQPTISKLIYYFKSIQPIFDDIGSYLSDIITCYQCTNSLSRSQKAIVVDSNINESKYFHQNRLNFEMNEFIKMSTQLMSKVRIISNIPHLDQILALKRKQFNKMLRNVMEARYTLSYLIKESQNLCLTPIRKVWVANSARKQKINAKSCKWKLAYYKKFSPRVGHCL